MDDLFNDEIEEDVQDDVEMDTLQPAASEDDAAPADGDDDEEMNEDDDGDGDGDGEEDDDGEGDDDEEGDGEEEEGEEGGDDDDEDDDDDEENEEEELTSPNPDPEATEPTTSEPATEAADSRSPALAKPEELEKLEPEPAQNGSPSQPGTPMSPRSRFRFKAQVALEFDIVPQVAIPYAGQCQAMAFTAGPKWILTGGEDGFIRKYDFTASIQGKLPLTMAQKHNLVDLITKAGVIVSYWENEQPVSKKELFAKHPKLAELANATYEPIVNPVYALQAERRGLWCVLGLLSGGINFYTMRHNEGHIHYYLAPGKEGHSDAVLVLQLSSDQTQLLSGSWDKTIRNWDLNTGKALAAYLGSSNQVLNIAYRPLAASPLELGEGEGDGEGNDEGNDDIDSLFGDDDDGDGDVKMEKPKPSSGAKTYNSDDIFMSLAIDGTINIWDARVLSPVIKLAVPQGTPPWCMLLAWSNDGFSIFAGRRNSTVEELSLRMPHKAGVTNVAKTLQFPKISGPVLALATMPNDEFLLCGSVDNIRLYNLKLYNDLAATGKKQATPFTIIPGHHGGVLSSLWVDDTGRFMVSASGNRGWGQLNYTDTVIIYEIDFEG